MGKGTIRSKRTDFYCPIISSNSKNKLNKVDKDMFVKKKVKDGNRITIGFCSYDIDETFFNYVDYLFGEYSDIINEYNVGNTKTLCQGYNNIINESKTDIILLCHTDIEFLEVDKYPFNGDISEIFSKLFEDNKDVGIIGIIGGSNINIKNPTWGNGEGCGRFVQGYNRNRNEMKYDFGTLQPYSNSLKYVATVDGVLIAVNKNRLKTYFDETNHSFHFYDSDLCISNNLRGVYAGVTKDIFIKHKSEGKYGKEWKEQKALFCKKWSDFLPINSFEKHSKKNRKKKL